MAQNWIKGAINPKHKGQFAAKAKAAGMTTRALADKMKASGGKTGSQARLALTLMRMHKAK